MTSGSTPISLPILGSCVSDIGVELIVREESGGRGQRNLRMPVFDDGRG